MTVTEHELKEAARAPRVTLEQVNAVIISEHYFTAKQGADAAQASERFLQVGLTGTWAGEPTPESLGLLTICVLTLKNGFTVHGVSACADPANFNAEIGRKISKSDAVNKIWPLLGYELKSKLDLVGRSTPLSGTMNEFGKDGAYGTPAQTYIGTKVIHAVPMDRKHYNILRGWKLPEDENPDDAGYLVEYADSQESNVFGFTGYVSWSPKEVFERAYSLVGASTPAKESGGDWLSRAKTEHSDLLNKIQKLDTFLRGPGVDLLPREDYSDLKFQREGMGLYLDALASRLRRAGVAL